MKKEKLEAIIEKKEKFPLNIGNLIEELSKYNPNMGVEIFAFFSEENNQSELAEHVYEIYKSDIAVTDQYDSETLIMENSKLTIQVELMRKNS